MKFRTVLVLPRVPLRFEKSCTECKTARISIFRVWFMLVLQQLVLAVYVVSDLWRDLYLWTCVCELVIRQNGTIWWCPNGDDCLVLSCFSACAYLTDYYYARVVASRTACFPSFDNSLACSQNKRCTFVLRWWRAYFFISGPRGAFSNIKNLPFTFS